MSSTKQNLQQNHQNDREVRLRFLRIDSAAAAALNEFWPVVQKEMPTILTGFYAHLMTEPALAQRIGTMMERLKGAQSSHWGRLFSGRFDQSYIDGVRTIGTVHNRIGLEPRWYIGGYAYVLSQLTDLAIRTYRWKQKRLAEVITAVNSAVMLDMDYAISVYQEAGIDERRNVVVMIASKLEESVGGIVTGLASQATELHATAEMMMSAAEQTLHQASAVADAAERAAANVESVASATEELSCSVNEIGQQVTRSTNLISGAVTQSTSANRQVQELAHVVQKIDDVVKLINDIAGQTNLLALNATIEAARAGEAGKGFAVVASEVKALANQTAKATGEIAAQIKGVQDASRTSAESIGGVTKSIGEVNESSTAIAAAVEEQGAATGEIARNVHLAAESTQGVSSAIVRVSQAAQQGGAAASQVLSAAGGLSRSGEALKSQVETLLREIRASA